jgi:hypothetical protein
VARHFAIALLAGLSLTLFVPAAAEAQSRDQSVRAVFGNCGDPCVIRYNPGGELKSFQAAASAVRRGARRLVVIDGPCISACAVFADIARSRVCITDRAVFGFHKATLVSLRSLRNGRTVRRELAVSDPPHSADIARWVKSRGGFPRHGFTRMSAREAASFWRRCSVRGA